MNLVDPRGRLTLERISLAPRPSREALEAGTVLFYDNLKMDIGHYGLLLPRIKEGLRARGVTCFADHRETIRGKTAEDIEAVAQKLSAEKPIAAVIALADMGVSPAMVALTIAMEKAGIPTVCVTAQPGSALAAAHAHYRAGSLCLVDVDIYHASGSEDVLAQADACVPRIFAMLSANGAELERIACIEYPLDTASAEEDGYLQLPGVHPSTPLALRSGRTELKETRKRVSHAHDPWTPLGVARPERSREAAESKGSGRTEHIDDEAAYELFEAMHIGDGLPVIAPTSERVMGMREYCPFDLGEVIVSGVGPSGTPITVDDVLVASVMAGCRPQFVPIVLTALRAMAKPQYGLLQAVTTSFSGGHFVLASGPIAREIGLHGGPGCLGPGFRANATIGRAVNLVLLNVCRSVPGYADLACVSSPAEYSYCFGEDPALSAWPAMHEERFDADSTCVMVLEAEAPHNILDVSTNGADLVETIVACCTTAGSNNASTAGNLVLVLNPDHARLLARDGYDKPRLRREIHASARLPLKPGGRGLIGVDAQEDTGGFHYVTRSPDDVEIVVAGGKGGHSVVILPWALHSSAVYEPVRRSDGTPAKRVDDLRWRRCGF